MVVLPILAAIFTAAGAASLKWYLNRSPLDVKTIICVAFIFCFLLTALLVPWFGSLDERIFEPRILLLFLVVAGMGLTQNYFTLKGLRTNSLHEYELIDILAPIFTIVLAAMAYADERGPVRLALALLASTAFLITHLKSRHIRFKRADRWLMYAVFVMAIERVLVKPIFALGSPVALYTIRNGIIALVLLVLFRPRLDKIALRDWLSIGGVTAFIVAGGMLLWVSISQFGIVFTELIMLLAPLLTVVFSVLFFKERWSFRQGVGFAVILVCIALVQFLPS